MKTPTLTCTKLLICSALLALPASALPRASESAAVAAEPSPVILIQNATILTASHGTVERGSILIKDGKIAEVGASVKVPKTPQVIAPSVQSAFPSLLNSPPPT